MIWLYQSFMYKPFSYVQAEYLQKSLWSWLNIIEGGKRAGKNIVNILAFAMNLETSQEPLHMVAGVTAALARLNIVEAAGLGLVNFFAGRCKFSKFDGSSALIINTHQGEKAVLFKGGGKSNDAVRIKGLSLGSVYISEANEVHRDFLFESIDRTLASKQRKIFLDLNPKNDGHWFYREFLNFQDQLAKKGRNQGYNYTKFTIFDNKSIPKERLQQALSSYDKSSDWYYRDILGMRSGAEHSIYKGFNEKHIVNINDLTTHKFIKFAIGIDVGGRDATCATLLGIDDMGRLFLLDGYYHKQGNENYMTHDLYVKEIVRHIQLWSQKYPAVGFGCAIFCESAEKLFRMSLSNFLRLNGFSNPVYASYKKDGVLQRIRLFCNLVATDRLRVASHLQPWIVAFYEASWDIKKHDIGEFVRLDNGSYPLDCLDSAEYGAMPYKNLLI